MRALWRAWWLLALAVGVPVVLVMLQTTVRPPGGWTAVLSGETGWDSAPVLLNLAAGVGWLFWAWALYEVGTAGVARMRQLRRTRPVVPAPAQGRVAALVGGAVLLLEVLSRTTAAASTAATPATVATVDTAVTGQSAGDSDAQAAADPMSASPDDMSLDIEGQPAGVTVPGGWLPTVTATAVAAAAAGFWLARRRQYRPRPPGAGRVDAPLPLPAGVVAVRRAAHLATADVELGQAPLAVTAGVAVVATAGATPHGPLLLADLPGDGLGLVGPAAAAAARAALVAATAARWPVAAVIHDLAVLLGNAAESAARLPAVTLAADLATVITQVSAGILPCPLLLFAASPLSVPATDQLTTLLANPGVVAVLLGGWPAGTTWHVDTDGTAYRHPAGTGPVARLGVLDPATTGDILATLAATHRQPPHAQPPPGRRDPTVPSPGTGQPAPRLADDAGRERDTPVKGGRLRLCVLGRPSLRRPYQDGSKGEVYLGRAAAWQILVYLAAHRDGASTDELKETLWPDVASSSARNRFNTTISHLRRTLADAAGGPVVQHSSDRAPGPTRHWLDPARIDVDLWQFQDASRRADTAINPDTRQHALIDAVGAYHGELAQTCSYDWAEPLREQLLGRVVDAYAHLADLQPDHHGALQLLQQAIHYSPHTEHLYRQAMVRHAASGNPDGVRRTLDTLTARLGEAGQQPDPATIALADTLTAEDAGRRR